MRHASIPKLYASMKVTIRREELRNAWRREIWPHLLMKKGVPTPQMDPQDQR